LVNAPRVTKSKSKINELMTFRRSMAAIGSGCKRPAGRGQDARFMFS
jgi:hypothetical protein